MKKSKKLFLLVASGSFATLPPVKQLESSFKKIYETGAIESKIQSFNDFFGNCSYNKTIIKFNTYRDYSNQSFFIKLVKHFLLLSRLLAAKFFKIRSYEKVYLYTFELFTLWLLIVLKPSNAFIIYHQFEIVLPNEINRFDNFYLNQINKKMDKVDLVIMPEVNRMEYFRNKVSTSNSQTQYFLLPNTNNNVNNVNDLRKSKIRISHIGALGENHCFESIINAICLLPEEKYELYLVGNITEGVKDRINLLNKPNVFVRGQVMHSELEEIYRSTDIGLILYDDDSLNTKYCAPNKLYEFWSFGIPVIGNKLPGLLGVFSNDCLGRLIDLTNIKLVVSTITELGQNELNEKMKIVDIFRKEKMLDNFLDVLKEKI